MWLGTLAWFHTEGGLVPCMFDAARRAILSFSRGALFLLQHSLLGRCNSAIIVTKKHSSRSEELIKISPTSILVYSSSSYIQYKDISRAMVVTKRVSIVKNLVMAHFTLLVTPEILKNLT